MNRIEEMFKKKGNRILNVYCTAGFPQLNSTLDVLQALEKYGADMIELGMPYSDPLADGPVIQQSSSVALKNGMTIGRLLSQLKEFRSVPPLGGNERGVPVILMGY